MEDWERFEEKKQNAQTGPTQNQSYGYYSTGGSEFGSNAGQTNTQQSYGQGFGQGVQGAGQGFGQGAQGGAQGFGGNPYYSNQGGYQQPPKQPKQPKQKKPLTMRAFVICMAICMVLSAAMGACGYMLMMSKFGGSTIDKSVNTTNYNISRSTGAVLSIQEIIARNQDSVVAISMEAVKTDFWMGQYVTSGAGSGVIISEDGYIVTNNHVVADTTSIKVTLNNGQEYEASLIATDPTTDIAVIKIDANGLTPATFGDMEKASVGDCVVAIGNPLGSLAGTATEGIISCLERELTIESQKMTLIQTSASVNPGNSGGGLFDQYGNLIGLVVAKSSGSDVEGLGFAIPCTIVKKVSTDLIETGHVQGRPAAGISIVDLTDAQRAMQYGVSMTGVYIQAVTGDNAKKAGLKAGDMIYYLDDTKITGEDQLIALVQSHKIGDKVTFTVVRDNEMLKIDLELEDSSTVNTDNNVFGDDENTNDNSKSDKKADKNKDKNKDKNDSQEGQDNQGGYDGSLDIEDFFNWLFNMW